jgi:hypothetical protein
LTDDRAAVPAFSLAVTANARSALLEITNGFFNVTVEGGENVSSLRWNLSFPQYSTVGRLVDALSREKGYETIADVALVRHHPAYDLRVDGIVDISNNKAYTLRHYIFSDGELLDLLEEATTAHNPNYTVNSIPAGERHYVLLKAQALGYMRLAADASKRRGMEANTDAFLHLARAVEEQYARDHARMERVLPSPKMDDSQVGQGDAMQGNLTRRSLRRGYTVPSRTAAPPVPPSLFDPADDDVEDTTIRLRWSQTKDERFAYYELWRDTQPAVERSASGRLVQQGDPASGGALPVNTQYTRMSTSKQVLGVGAGMSPVFDGFFFSTASELAGTTNVNTFIDGMVVSNPSTGAISVLGEPLEPSAEYYYRVYITNWNGEATASEVKRYRTKTLRARFKRAGYIIASDAMSLHAGPLAGGTELTVLGTAFSEGMYVTIGGKRCTEVSRTATSIVVTTPAFVNPDFVGRAMDAVLHSPTGLKDILLQAWAYT